MCGLRVRRRPYGSAVQSVARAGRSRPLWAPSRGACPPCLPATRPSHGPALPRPEGEPDGDHDAAEGRRGGDHHPDAAHPEPPLERGERRGTGSRRPSWPCSRSSGGSSSRPAERALEDDLEALGHEAEATTAKYARAWAAASTESASKKRPISVSGKTRRNTLHTRQDAAPIHVALHAAAAAASGRPAPRRRATSDDAAAAHPEPTMNATCSPRRPTPRPAWAASPPRA